MMHSDKTKRPIPPQVQHAARELAENVATWRKLRGLTQAQLADRAGIGRNTVARLERGEAGISTENLLRVLRGLGLIEALITALDPYETDIGRLRADEHLPKRVRPRSLVGRANT